MMGGNRPNTRISKPGSGLFQGLLAADEVDVSDRYFLGFTPLNSECPRINPMTYNETMGPREIAFNRLAFMLTNSVIGYLFTRGASSGRSVTSFSPNAPPHSFTDIDV